MLHTQTRVLENGMRGTKQNSNHVRDFADVTETESWFVVYLMSPELDM